MPKIRPQINPAIVIPMHKQDPSPEEWVSLTQCQKILGDYPIYLLHPQGMLTKAYEEIFPSLLKLAAPTECMASIAAYNKMMISPLIFNTLKQHSHILIHEPDAIVLKNDLQYWCEQDFDYIGAPWFASDAPENLQLKATGNSGLSLINTKAVNDLFAANPRWFNASMILREFLRSIRGKKGAFQKMLKAIGSSGKLARAHELYQDHCDIFWSYLAPRVAPSFRIAPTERAICFSWEKSPKKSFEICKGELPFGIHAWFKYDLEFLRPFLLKSGVALDALDSN